MTGKLCVPWTLTAPCAPIARRHCATCGATQAFVSSGKVRLNANGRQLDAWLIYRCAVCERTWNRTLLERTAVRNVSEADLDAMQQSAPDWVRRHEFDREALRRQAGTAVIEGNPRVVKPMRQTGLAIPEVIEITLLVGSGTGLRLDRLLSQELPIARHDLRSCVAAGGLVIRPSAKAALRRPINADMTITLVAAAFPAPEFARILDAVFQA